MGNLIINIRVLCWHLQVSSEFKIKIYYNVLHKEYPCGKFQIYTFLPFKK